MHQGLQWFLIFRVGLIWGTLGWPMTSPGDHNVTAYKNFSRIFVIGQSEYALNSLVRDQKHVSDSNDWLFSLLRPNWQIWGSQEPKIWWKLVKNWIFLRENCKGWFCKVSYFTGWHAQTFCQCHKSGCYLFGQVQRVQKGWIWPKMLKSHFWGIKINHNSNQNDGNLLNSTHNYSGKSNLWICKRIDHLRGL